METLNLGSTRLHCDCGWDFRARHGSSFGWFDECMRAFSACRVTNSPCLLGTESTSPSLQEAEPEKE
jgi:hypothetical protein